MKVDVHDKDEGALNDDYIGSFSTDISSGMKVGTLKGFTQDRGSFGLNVSMTLYDFRNSCSSSGMEYTGDGNAVARYKRSAIYIRRYAPTHFEYILFT